MALPAQSKGGTNNNTAARAVNEGRNALEVSLEMVSDMRVRL
jgi:hypothetical protein